MDSLRIFDVIYATTMGGPNDATTNLHDHGLPIFLPVVPDGQGHGRRRSCCSLLVVIASYLLLRLWNRAAESTAQ